MAVTGYRGGDPPRTGQRLAAASLAICLLLAACDDDSPPRGSDEVPPRGSDEVPQEQPSEPGQPDPDVTDPVPDTAPAPADDGDVEATPPSPEEVIPRRVEVSATDLREDELPPYLETGTASGFLEIVDDAGDGLPAVLAGYRGEGANGFARLQLAVDWRDGDDVEYGFWFYLPEGFLDAQLGAVDLIRWDNFAVDARRPDHGGLTISSSGELHLSAQQLGADDYRYLLGPVDVTEGEWTEVRVHQHLSQRTGIARNTLWVDGEEVATTDDANTTGRPVTRIRVGLVSIDADEQENDLDLLFDDVEVYPVGSA